jgi:hypothetical protein
LNLPPGFSDVGANALRNACGNGQYGGLHLALRIKTDVTLTRRTAGGFVALVAALFIGGLLIGYGEVEPCRVLAVEKARRASLNLPDPKPADLETWTRVETSQMSAGQCVSALLDSWGARVTAK